LTDALLRFVIGGFVVSAFAMAGGLFKPPGFAGLLGAAPSIALVALALTITNDGKLYARSECFSMMAGAVALCLYALLVIQLLSRFQVSALRAALSSLALWFLTAFGLWRVLVR